MVRTRLLGVQFSTLSLHSSRSRLNYHKEFERQYETAMDIARTPETGEIEKVAERALTAICDKNLVYRIYHKISLADNIFPLSTFSCSYSTSEFLRTSEQ